MKSIDTIQDIGGIDADTDRLLMKCFQDHDAFNEIINFEKFIVLGRKGTGKTAIYRRLLNNKEYDYFSLGHTLADYPWHHHDKQAKLGVGDSQKSTHSWKYFILLALSKIILNQDSSLPHDEASLDYMTEIESFVVDTYGTRDPKVTQIFTPPKKLKLKATLSTAQGLLKGGISSEAEQNEYLPRLVQETNSNLIKSVIESLNPINKYFILFDELDIGFDPEDIEYKNRLIGLLQAAKEINRAAKEKDKKLSIVVFLRDDIYNILRFEDKNKLTESSTTMIEWDSTGGYSLKSLLEKRLTELLRETEKEEIRWDMVFDETKKMTGKQTKYKYIKDRTFLRPRDAIKFTNEILTRHKAKENQDKNLITNEDINDARENYSRYLFRELEDEIPKHIPGYKALIEVIKSIGYHEFRMQDFESAEKKKASKGKDLDAYESLKILFEFSIIGYKKTGGRGGGSNYVFRYKNSGAQFDEGAMSYRVHPGLIDHLQLKRRPNG